MLFFFKKYSVRVCVYIFIEPILRHFSLVVAISFILIIRCLLCGECWTIQKRREKKNKNKKHCRVCLQQFWKMRSCKCVPLYRPHFEFADSICASNGCMWFLCTCVCVWMCAYVHEWVMMEKQTKFCFYSSYIFPRRLKKQLFLFSFNRSSIHFTLYPNAFHFRRQTPIENSICLSYSQFKKQCQKI